MINKQKTIRVVVDKNHIFTLGEKMYIESVELIRELVNNAYDADAAQVYIYINPESIVVEDNGTGMNEKGLAKFFIVGPSDKKENSLTPRFGRKRIGQFGIGKFAVLSAANRFVVESKKGKYVYRVVFDKKNWEETNNWELPISKDPATPFDHQGTKVVLTKLRKKFSVPEVKKYLHSSIPLRAKKFSVYLNGQRITKKEIVGRNIPVNFKTIYGNIEGEVIIALNSKDIEKPGIDCLLKQVLIRKELFGSDKKFPQIASKIAGEVSADFLPIVASRNDFVHDSAEYKFFYQLMNNFLFKILEKIKKERKSKDLEKISKQLKEVLGKIRKALELNPDFIPSRKVIARLKKKNKASKKKKKTIKETEKEDFKEKENVAVVLEKPEISKRIRLKKLGVTVGIVSLGQEGSESVAEGNAVYINQDHPLYQKFYNNQEAFSLYLARLITKEIILMKRMRISAQQAYNSQSKLLTDIFSEKERKRTLGSGSNRDIKKKKA